MFIRWLFAAFHLLALGIGLGAVWARGRALGGNLDAAGIRRALRADTWWGVAALLWVGTGLARAFGGLEKGTVYYVQNDLFLGKMALFVLILALEIGPMVALVQWRIQLARGQQPDTRSARRYAWISFVQAVLVVLMVLAATAMARGLGVRHA